jgi:site-specific DNA-methyltransferase (adenine-specific)
MSNIDVSKQIVMKKLNEVKPYVRNPRKNDKTVDLLCKIIPKVGFNVPLVIDENGIIVK